MYGGMYCVFFWQSLRCLVQLVCGRGRRWGVGCGADSECDWGSWDRERRIDGSFVKYLLKDMIPFLFFLQGRYFSSFLLSSSSVGVHGPKETSSETETHKISR